MTADRARPADRVVTAIEERRDVVIDAIRHAERRIALSLFRCTDKAIFKALAAAVARGVEVEVVVTSRAKGGKQKLSRLWDALEQTGATIHPYTDAVVKYHAKYLVVDDGPALVGSLNFTKKCFTRTVDAIVVTYDPAVVAGLRALMVADRQGQAASPTIAGRLIVGPERARQQFTTLISTAASSIHLIDAKLSDPSLVTLLNARRAAGVHVEILSDPWFGSRKSHGKIMLIDRSRAVVGGLALAALSLDFRREVAIVVDEPSAVAVVETLFRSMGAHVDGPRSVPVVTAGGASC